MNQDVGNIEMYDIKQCRRHYTVTEITDIDLNIRRYFMSSNFELHRGP